MELPRQGARQASARSSVLKPTALASKFYIALQEHPVKEPTPVHPCLWKTTHFTGRLMPPAVQVMAPCLQFGRTALDLLPFTSSRQLRPIHPSLITTGFFRCAASSSPTGSCMGQHGMAEVLVLGPSLVLPWRRQRLRN